MTLAEFRRVYPTAALHGQQRETLYLSLLSNPQAKATLVLLTGGIGLSDLFYISTLPGSPGIFGADL